MKEPVEETRTPISISDPSPEEDVAIEMLLCPHAEATSTDDNEFAAIDDDDSDDTLHMLEDPDPAEDEDSGEAHLALIDPYDDDPDPVEDEDNDEDLLWRIDPYDDDPDPS